MTEYGSLHSLFKEIKVCLWKHHAVYPPPPSNHLFNAWTNLSTLLSRHQKAGQNHDIKIGNMFWKCGTVQVFGNDSNKSKFEIKRWLNSGNACYHSVQNLLSSHLLSKNIKIRIYKTITWLLVLYGCETYLVSDIKGGTQTGGVWEQGVDENIWTNERWSGRGKTATCTLRQV
jgi:hypothetical protein